MSDVGSAETLGHPSTPGRSVNLVGLLEERVGGLVDRYRGAQKSADELRSRLDAAEAEISTLHARVEDADRLRGALRERVQVLIEQVCKLEESTSADENGEAPE